MDLEARDASHRAGGCADFGGEVGECRQVVSGESGLIAEPRPGQLHTVAGIPGESDRNTIDLLGGFLILNLARCHAEPFQGWLEPSR